MDEVESIKIKVSNLNTSILESFKDSKESETKEEKVKNLKFALERAEEAYKHLKGLRNVPSDILDYEVSRLRIEYNLFMLYVLNNQIYDAKKCLDKIRFNPTLPKLDNYKQRKLIIVSLNLAITYISSNKNDINALDNGIECFEFVIEHFFDTFSFNNENFTKYYAQMISVFIYILNNDKEKIKKYVVYANKVILYKEADGKLDVNFSKLYSDLALNFAKVDFDVSKGLLDKALEVMELNNIKDKNELVVGIIYNNYTALYNRYKKYKDAIDCKPYSVDLVQQNLEKKKDNKFLKFQLSDSCFNIGYAYVKFGELENMDENNEKAKEHFWTSYAQAKDIFYVANQYESLEANATIESRYNNEKLLNSLEYFNQALKVYNKSIDNKTNKETDEINKRLNNKIRIIQAKLNEANLQEAAAATVDDKKNGNTANDDDDDVYDRPRKISKIKTNNVNNDENKKPTEEEKIDEPIYSKVTVHPDRSHPKDLQIDPAKTETGEVAVVATNRSSVSNKTTSSSGTTGTTGTTESTGTETSTGSSSGTGTGTGTETDVTGSTSQATTSRSSNTNTNTTRTTEETTTDVSSTVTPSDLSSDTKSTKSKKSKEESSFDKIHYEGVVQLLVKQNLVRKRPEVAILYPDFNKGRVPKNLPTSNDEEGGSQICTIL